MIYILHCTVFLGFLVSSPFLPATTLMVFNVYALTLSICSSQFSLLSYYASLIGTSMFLVVATYHLKMYGAFSWCCGFYGCWVVLYMGISWWFCVVVCKNFRNFVIMGLKFPLTLLSLSHTFLFGVLAIDEFTKFCNVSFLALSEDSLFDDSSFALEWF